MAINQAMLQALARQKAAGKTPTGLKSIAKPKDIQDIFDEQLAGASQAQFPNTWRPPAITDPQINDYIAGVHGAGVINQINATAYKTKAPSFFKVQNSLAKTNPENYNLSQLVAAYILNGVPESEVMQRLITPPVDQSGKAIGKAPLDVLGVLDADAQKAVTLLYNEYNAAENAKSTLTDSWLKSNDPYYKASLPHPKLKYGQRTNLSKGIIGVETLPSPSVKQFIDTETQKVSQMRQTTPGVAPSSYMDPTAFVAEVVTKKGQTPFKDEAIRRQALKGKNIKP